MWWVNKIDNVEVFSGKRILYDILVDNISFFRTDQSSYANPSYERMFFFRGIGNSWEAMRSSGPGFPEEVPLWTLVTLPHCFNADNAVDLYVNYYQGQGGIKLDCVL